MEGDSLDTKVSPSSDCLGKEGEGGRDLLSMTACLSLCDLEEDLSPPCDLELDLTPDLSCDLLELLSPCDLPDDLSLCDLSLSL